MDLSILSTAPHCYSTARLVDVAEEQGHSVTVINPLKCSVDLDQLAPAMYYKSEPMAPPDAILPRIASSLGVFGTAVVRQFERLGVFAVNSSASIAASHDRLRNLQMLVDRSARVPDTALVRDRRDLVPAIERLGGFPVMLKVIDGSSTLGTVRVDSFQLAQAVTRTLRPERHFVIVYRFEAAENNGLIRAFVVGDEVVGATRAGALAGSVEPIDLDNQFHDCAVHAAAALGLRIAGVDMLSSSDGPLVTGVCSSPGLKQIEQATGVDIAGAVINYIAAQIDFPHRDATPTFSHEHVV